MKDLVTRIRTSRKICPPSPILLPGMLLLVVTVLSGPGCQTVNKDRFKPLPAQSFPSLDLGPEDRIMILAPHPDDEVLGAGGIAQRAVEMGLPIHETWLTYGDNNEWSFTVYRKHPVFRPKEVRTMGEVRHAESTTAAGILGISPEHLTFLGYPDFGTLHIWDKHWGNEPAFRSMLTKVTEVPYPDAYRPGAPYKGDDILADLTAILREFKPTKVFVSHPADHNCDHAALYLYTTIALWNLEDEIRPEVYPYLIHWPEWPQPAGYHPDLSERAPSELVPAIDWKRHALAPEHVERKKKALGAEVSQMDYSDKFMLAFARSSEVYGDLPVIELEQGGQHVVASKGNGIANVPHHFLEEDEKAAHVGVEHKTVSWDGDELVVSVSFSAVMGRDAEASIFIFGYRKDRPFQDMPKIHLQVGSLKHELFDQSKELSLEEVQVEQHQHNVTVHVPLSLLGNPERVLMSTRTYANRTPLDWSPWRTLQFPGTAGTSAGSN